MNIERVDWLVDSVLDGVATVEERAELERLVAADPEVRARVAEHEELFGLLRRVPVLAPPDDLRDSILATIRSETTRMTRSGWIASWRSLIARHPRLGLSYAVAAGLVIGSLATLGMLGTIGREPDLSAPVSGTMGAPTGAEHVLDRAGLDLPGGRLEAETGSIGSTVRLRLHGRASVPFEVSIAFRPHELRLVSVVPPPTGTLNLEGSAGRLVLQSDGDMNLKVDWDPRVPAASPIRIGSRVNGKEETMIMTVSSKVRESPSTP